VSGNAWSLRGGYTHVNRTYFGSSTTHTLNAVPVQRSRDIYSHDAMFFKKIDTSKSYGVNWFVPKRLPTEAADAPIQVRVLAVLKGSQAEKDGIKRGQIVKAINGVAIKTRKDMAPFLDASTVIKNVEAEDVK
jgi:S1-C subfamily serine protease